MNSTIDSEGRVEIPKALRDRLGLKGGQSVAIRERNGVIEIEPNPVSMVLVDRGKGPVAVPEHSLASLTNEMVRATIERTRR